jgi:hypothetical protein
VDGLKKWVAQAMKFKTGIAALQRQFYSLFSKSLLRAKAKLTNNHRKPNYKSNGTRSKELFNSPALVLSSDFRTYLNWAFQIRM